MQALTTDQSFEVGMTYEAYDSGINPIRILRRTKKTVWVDNGQSKWCMRVMVDVDGNEFVADSTVPRKWKEAFTYSAKWPTK